MRRPVRSLSQQLGRYASVEEVVPVEALKEGTGVPLFCIHPGGGLGWAYQALGNYLDCPIIGIQQILQSEEVEPAVNLRHGEKLCRQNRNDLSYRAL